MSKDTVTENLYTLSTGDEVYRYEKSIVIFFKGKRKVLSTSVFNGGYHENYTAVFNHDAKQGAGMPCEMLAPTYTEHMQILSGRLGLDPETVTGMGTAADMEHVAIETLTYENLTVTAIVTGGIETNGGRVGDPATFFKPLEKPDRIQIFRRAPLRGRWSPVRKRKPQQYRNCWKAANIQTVSQQVPEQILRS